MEFESVGVVHSKFIEPEDPFEMREEESVIEVHPKYEEGLYKIEKNERLQIVFFFHKSDDYRLKGPRRNGDVRGLFASRSPNRPGKVGITTVKLLERKGNELRVEGLDAIEGTPVVDIKPYASPLDEGPKENPPAQPRTELNHKILDGNVDFVLREAGKLHGHFCPFLSLGVRAGVYATKELGTHSEGMEETLSIVETNSCFTDGIQYSTGNTFGNNGLIYRDFGKTAFTLADRKGNGIRLRVKEEGFRNRRDPETEKLFEKVVENREGTEKEEKLLREKSREEAFDLLKPPMEELFQIKKGVQADLPDYAPIFEDEYCSDCGEKVMAPKAVEKAGKKLCLDCAEEDFYQLDGRGLSLQKPGSKEDPSN
uniref:Formylmethanofuran dehydrogenase subunit E region n=1 Tax=uncultured organism TaxID=155900 RepID=M1QA18_9ZZZZ|nr:formylmethanofuran dehydrogenase subunit E region [uncultured organism]